MAKEEKKKPALTYNLEYPITWGDSTILELSFRRPKGKDFKNLGQSPTVRDIARIGVACCLRDDSSEALFDELDGYDYSKILEEINSFLENGRKTGKKR